LRQAHGAQGASRSQVRVAERARRIKNVTCAEALRLMSKRRSSWSFAGNAARIDID
jgi:hypothetical protein